MAKLLIVDDEPNVVYSLENSLKSADLQVITAPTGKKGLKLAREESPDVILLDVRLPDLSGLDVLQQLMEIDPRSLVVVVTAHGTTDTAIEATKRGAFEYLVKPFDFHQLRAVLNEAIELSRLRHVPAVFDQADPGELTVDRIVGNSPVMRDVYKAIGRVAPQDLTVLLQGESGTGKELVARAIYHHSRRSQGPFLALNCAAIPETLLESELFGHERAAFTGAERRRIGKFEQCNHGTIFLDEIGDMTSATQAKVLRLLQEQAFERVGGNETIRTDVRIIAATNQDLEKLAGAGRFRLDLFYRLNAFTIRLPALRDRLDDLPLLVQYFLAMFDRELNKQVVGLSPQAMKLLETYRWPGNVRELQSAIKYAIVQATGDLILPQHLPESIRTGKGPDSPTERGDAFDLIRLVRGLLQSGELEIYRRVSDSVDRVVLTEVLRHTRGNLGQACDLLGISRGTLRAKLRSIGLGVEKQVLADFDKESQKVPEV